MLSYRVKANVAGFSLIELVVVIIVIGILATVAVPKLFDLSSDARQSSVNSVAGALNTASSANYHKRISSGFTAGIPVANCTDVSGVLSTSNQLPSGYSISSAEVDSGAPKECTVTYGSSTATFIAYGTS
jgi:MSHA pilin protein MshA